MRADRNGDGEVDFLEFLMMSVGLINFNFPDEIDQNSNKPQPTLVVNSPPIVAGAYDVLLGHDQQPPEGITGSLIYFDDKETPPEDFKDSITLIDPSRDSSPLEEQIAKATELGAIAIIVCVEEKP